MKFDNYMILEFPSKSTNEAFARSAVACFAAQMDPTLEELGDIRTAVSEAVTNCIVHAYPDELGIITLRCRILKDHVLDNNIHVGIYHDPELYLPMDRIGEMDALWDEAEAMAEDAETLERVKKSRMQLRYLKLYNTPADAPGLDDLVDEFAADLAKYGIKYMREGMPLEQSIRRMRNGHLMISDRNPELD
jgi:stage II sporulation protein AB (anti-sigma F factor)